MTCGADWADRPARRRRDALALLAGCGGDNGVRRGRERAARSRQLDAALRHASTRTLGSDQWQRLQDLLDRFPGRDRLVEELQKALADGGVTWEEIDDAFGPTVDFAVLDLSDEGVGVGLTQPDDRAQARGAAREERRGSRRGAQDGWFAFSDDRASTPFESAPRRGTLATTRVLGRDGRAARRGAREGLRQRRRARGRARARRQLRAARSAARSSR